MAKNTNKTAITVIVVLVVVLFLMTMNSEKYTPEEQAIIYKMEEQNKMMIGEERMKKYVSKMPRCTLKYVPLNSRVQLVKKWYVMGRLSNKTSECFVLQAADCYSHKYRLRNALQLIKNGADWVQQSKGYFYNIITKKMILFDSKNYTHPCALNMSVKTNLIRRLPYVLDIHRGIDSFLFITCELVKGEKLLVYCDDEQWEESLDTDGFNLISSRNGFYTKPTPPFYKASKRLPDILSKDLCKKLKY